METRLKPTFIGIGAQKCASTWLYQVLAEHPEVCVSARKEIDFFSYHYDHGYQWYERQFEGCQEKRAVGEISPSYFSEPAVPSRVRLYAPEAKILVSFRDPVQRALSNHRHEVRVGHITGDDLSFETGLANNPMYVEQGCYATHLKRWLEYFPEDQILVVLQEDIAKDPLEVARKVYAFLGVDETYLPEQLNRQFNKSFANRSHSVANVKDLVYSLTRWPVFRWLWRLGSAVGIKALYRRLNTVPSAIAIPDTDEQTLVELRKRFAPEVSGLSELINQRLDVWK